MIVCLVFLPTWLMFAFGFDTTCSVANEVHYGLVLVPKWVDFPSKVRWHPRKRREETIALNLELIGEYWVSMAERRDGSNWSSQSNLLSTHHNTEVARSPVPYHEKLMEYEPTRCCSCKAKVARWFS